MTGRIRKKTEMAGVGRLSQLVGIVIFLGSLGAFPIGTAIGFIIMISLFIIGRQMATTYYCGNCGNPVDNRKVKICPVCKISLN
jgi:hypothetical protein